MISITIPAYNAETTIGNTLKTLLDQNYPKNKYEIIVVDDGSADKTVEIASKFPVKVIRAKHAGPSNARNLGAKKAKGGILLFVDSDCIPDRNWIKNMVEPFKNKEIVGVSGTYKTLNKNKFMARFTGYEIEQRHEQMKKKKYIDFIGSYSAGYRKNIFLKFGGFDTRFKIASGEDPELSYRIAKAGFKMIFQPKAFVYHSHPDTIQKYLKQKYQRAIWRNLMYWEKHKEKIISDSYTHKLLFPQAFISGLTFLIFLSLFFLGYGLLFTFSLIFISFLIIAFIFNLDVISFFWKKEKKIALLAPFIFLLRNIVGILGVLVGLAKFAFKKI